MYLPSGSTLQVRFEVLLDKLSIFSLCNFVLFIAANGGAMLLPRVPSERSRVPPQESRVQQHQQDTVKVRRRLGLEHDCARATSGGNLGDVTARLDARYRH